MKLPPFDYLCAGSLDEAVAALADDEDAKVVAGGQSLLPLLALRLARPSVLVDIDRLGLDDVRVVDGVLHLGALIRQRRIEFDPAVARAAPLLADAVTHVGYPATRNRGTLGGSLAHADPVAELPAVAVALGATVVVEGPAGTRRIPAGELADGHFTTTLGDDEVLTEMIVPAAGAAGHGAAWCEWARRAHDFAEAGVGVDIDLDGDGTCVAVRAAACGVGDRPLQLGPALTSAGVLGAQGSTPALSASVALAAEAAAGSAGDDRAALVGLLAARSVHRALTRALTAGRLAA